LFHRYSVAERYMYIIHISNWTNYSPDNNVSLIKQIILWIMYNILCTLKCNYVHNTYWHDFNLKFVIFIIKLIIILYLSLWLLINKFTWVKNTYNVDIKIVLTLELSKQSSENDCFVILLKITTVHFLKIFRDFYYGIVIYKIKLINLFSFFISFFQRCVRASMRAYVRACVRADIYLNNRN